MFTAHHSAFVFRSGQGAIFHEKKPRANQTRASKYLTAAKNMVIANGRSPRRKRTTSPEERVEEIVGEMPEIFQPLPGSPGRLTKSQQRKQQAAKLNAKKQTRRTIAVESCSSTPPSRDSIEFGSPKKLFLLSFLLVLYLFIFWGGKIIIFYCLFYLYKDNIFFLIHNYL